MTSCLQLSDCVKDGSEAERGQATWWNKPIVPFIPNKPEEGSGTSTSVEILVKVNDNEKLGVNNQVKLSIKKFAFGGVEELIRWRQDLERVIVKKPVREAKSMFDMAEMLLAEDPLQTFRDFRRTVCFTEPATGEDPPGETVETFNSVLNRWLRHYFPQVNKAPATKQKSTCVSLFGSLAMCR